MSIKNWFDRQKAIKIRTHIANTPNVQEARECMAKLSKRKSSDSSVGAKVLKKAANESLKTSVRVSTVAKIVNLTSPN